MLEVFNNQEAIDIDGSLIEKFEYLANQAISTVLDNTAHGGGVLASLEFVEVSIVDDETIEQVHIDFMGIEGATDVITFEHGEIVVSVETAKLYSSDYEQSWQRELFLYIIHGLLHLAGHEDAIAEERQTMEVIQFRVVNDLWPVNS